jgi:hypothetical protein
MGMKASEIISRAFSLADLTGSELIDHDYQVASINESWKDLYTKLIGRDDDFFLETATIAITPAMKEDETAYLIPMPANMQEIRTIDLKTSGDRWVEVEKFPLSVRNDCLSGPYYRLQNGNLWLLVSQTWSLSDLRIRYYPPAAEITTPDVALEFSEDVAAYEKDMIESPFYLGSDRMLYVLDGLDVILEDIAGGLLDTITTGTAITQIFYYKGYLYILDGGAISRGILPIPFVGTFSGSVVLASATITSFGIIGNKIYYYDGTNTRTANLDGTGTAIVGAYPSASFCKVGDLVAYITTGKAVIVGTIDIGITADEITSDGTYIYARLGVVLFRTDSDGTNLIVMLGNSSLLGNYASDYLAFKNEDGELFAISKYIDYDISYPLNVVQEIMSYQGAVDYRTKIEKSSELLLTRLAALWDRFSQSIKRDCAKPERINNHYRNRGNW